ncbi:hypothetical protein BDZ91DRAFT_784515 [Kalaharituber pfeilii]|nr:hypothetical protein BDZ91DRAFT_784515 [Kalaharituber pfeilii]
MALWKKLGNVRKWLQAAKREAGQIGLSRKEALQMRGRGLAQCFCTWRRFKHWRDLFDSAYITSKGPWVIGTEAIGGRYILRQGRGKDAKGGGGRGRGVREERVGCRIRGRREERRLERPWEMLKERLSEVEKVEMERWQEGNRTGGDVRGKRSDRMSRIETMRREKRQEGAAMGEAVGEVTESWRARGRDRRRGCRRWKKRRRGGGRGDDSRGREAAGREVTGEAIGKATKRLFGGDGGPVGGAVQEPPPKVSTVVQTTLLLADRPDWRKDADNEYMLILRQCLDMYSEAYTEQLHTEQQQGSSAASAVGITAANRPPKI